MTNSTQRMGIQAIFFDMDGVLTNSLEPHLRYCARIADDFGLSVKIPSANEFKYSIARSGTQISPMFNFFRAIGFSPKDASLAFERYSEEFAKETVDLFPGIEQGLSVIAGELRIPMGLVTSNIRSSVVTALKDNLELFCAKCVFALDDIPHRTKAEAILAGVHELKLEPSEVLFIGDQHSDQEASTESGVRFLGVTYGWCIAPEDTEFETVTSPEEIVAFARTLVDEVSPA